jgi:hypothetical protein
MSISLRIIDVAIDSIPGSPPTMVGRCIEGLPTVATCRRSTVFW